MNKDRKTAHGKKNPERKQRVSLTVLLSLVVFVILLAAVTIAAVGVVLLNRFGLTVNGGMSIEKAALLAIGVSALMGWVFSMFVFRIPLAPINQAINKMNLLAEGEYDTSLKFKGIVAHHPAFAEMSLSFNKLAEELRNTELLRSDFINNFSHEFKTPIVSIAGFARLLRRAELTEAEREQYLAAIEEESTRLADMATNVLTLTRVENQGILTDKTDFNLSEQLRSCVLLLEAEWTRKEIDIEIDLEEYTVRASEEMLKEVWINLLSNAFKFTPRGGRVAIGVALEADSYAVSVLNTGSEIPPDKQEKVFRKFYQCDESHAGKGNGVGLAIVRRVVELHEGSISLTSGGGETVFTVYLPR